ncbi:MAG TPA: hypothetical protein VH763_12365 [Gemmatimonadales bacterium]
MQGRVQHGWSLILVAQLSACASWHTEQVAPEQVLAAEQPDRIRITEPGGAQVIVLRPTIAGDTLHGSSQAGGYSIAIPLAKVFKLETRQSNLVTSEVVVAALGIGVVGILVACAASSC